MNFTIKNLTETSSTNDYLKNYLQNNTAEEGLVVWARDQTNGRGQGSNSWESEKNKNLTFSLCLQPTFLPAADMFMVSKAISLGVLTFLESKCSGFKIKWPNDLYFNDKKIGGILIENQLLGCCLSYSFIGIGLNINQEVFTSDAPNPISLKNILSTELNLTDCLNQILEEVKKWYTQLAQENYSLINNEYHNNLYRVNTFHNYKAENNKFSAKIVKVETDGNLILELQNGTQKSFYFKEVEFIL